MHELTVFYTFDQLYTINPGGDNLYTADQICRMVEFLIDNIFVKFGGCLFYQVIERIVPPC